MQGWLPSPPSPKVGPTVLSLSPHPLISPFSLIYRIDNGPPGPKGPFVLRRSAFHGAELL